MGSRPILLTTGEQHEMKVRGKVRALTKSTLIEQLRLPNRNWVRAEIHTSVVPAIKPLSKVREKLSLVDSELVITTRRGLRMVWRISNKKEWDKAYKVVCGFLTLFSVVKSFMNCRRYKDFVS